MAEDDAHATGINALGPGRLPGLSRGVQGQPKNRVEPVQQAGVKLQALEFEWRGITKASADRVDLVGPRYPGIECPGGLEDPAPRWHHTGGVDDPFKSRPEAFRVWRAW